MALIGCLIVRGLLHVIKCGKNAAGLELSLSFCKPLRVPETVSDAKCVAEPAKGQLNALEIQCSADMEWQAGMAPIVIRVNGLRLLSVKSWRV